MSIRVYGFLDRPGGAPAANAAIQFRAMTNFGDTLVGSTQGIVTDEYGQYDITLEYGEYAVDILFDDHFIYSGRILIHDECANPSTLNTLLSKMRPVTPDEVSYLETLMANTQIAAGEADMFRQQTSDLHDATSVLHGEVTNMHAEVTQDADDTRANTLDVQQRHADIITRHDDVTEKHTQVIEDAAQVAEDRAWVEEAINNPDIDLPIPPASILVEAHDTHLNVIPDDSVLGFNSEFEFYLIGEDPDGPLNYYGRGRVIQIIGLIPERTYHFAVRTVNELGFSGYKYGSGTTTNDGTSKEQIGLPPDYDLIGEFDRIENNYNEIVADLSEQSSYITIINRDLQDVTDDLNQTSAEWNARHAEMEQRIIDGESLIDAVVTKDPETGQIINKAFEYTDTSYNEAMLRIDGVDNTIQLHTEALNATDETLSQHTATLQLHEGKIQSQVTYTEMEEAIAGAVSAVEPAEAWYFNTGVDGWTGGTWNSRGTLETVGDVSISGLDIDADTNTTVRVTLRTQDSSTALLELCWNGGRQRVAFSGIGTDDQFIVVTLNLTASDGWTGQVTDIQLLGSAMEIDAIVVGRPSANEQQLDSLTGRVATVEETLDAENARWDVYVTTDFWDQNALTSTDVQQQIDGWDATWGVTATMQQLADEDTIAKASSAQLWVDGAEANVTAITQVWWDNGPSSQLNNAIADIDAVNSKITLNTSSITGLEQELEVTDQKSLEIAYQQLLEADKTTKQGVSLAWAQDDIQTLTEDGFAQAVKITQLEAVTENTASEVVRLDQAVSTLDSALASTETNLRAELVQGDSSTLSEANTYTRAAVGYWVDSYGRPGTPPDPDNPPAGWRWIDGPLAEDIRQLQISTNDGQTASIRNIAQTYETVDGNLVARGGMLFDVNGKVSGTVSSNDGTISTMDIIADQFSVGTSVGSAYYPKLYLDSQDGKMTLDGKLVIGGSELSSADDIAQLSGPSQFYMENSSGSFPSSASTVESEFKAKYGFSPRTNDHLTYYKLTNGEVVASEVRRFNGSTWTAPEMVVNGDILAKGSVTGDSIHAESVITIGSGDDVVKLHGTGTTYRLWVGNYYSTLANFSVTKEGNLFARNAEVEGKITATSGTFSNVTIDDTCNVENVVLKGVPLTQRKATSFSNKTSGTGGSFTKVASVTMNLGDGASTVLAQAIVNLQQHKTSYTLTNGYPIKQEVLQWQVKRGSTLIGEGSTLVGQRINTTHDNETINSIDEVTGSSVFNFTPVSGNNVIDLYIKTPLDLELYNTNPTYCSGTLTVDGGAQG